MSEFTRLINIVKVIATLVLNDFFQKLCSIKSLALIFLLYIFIYLRRKLITTFSDIFYSQIQLYIPWDNTIFGEDYHI